MEQQGHRVGRHVRSLSAQDAPPCRHHDVAMLDLDGVVYRGGDAVPHAVETLARAREQTTLAYVTNNASRTPGTVVATLRGLGLEVGEDDVVTSAQAVARMVAAAVPSGSTVLVVGGEGLRVALEGAGLVCTDSLDDGPAAVVQGFGQDVGWRQLAEATYAVRAGVPWFASNTDLTIPTARGIAPGNGTLVRVVAQATGQQPAVAGKPYPPLFEETLRRVGGERPLVVGDRLDTDLEGANAIGAAGLFVLTGVDDLAAAAAADPVRRPSLVAPDLRGLLHPHPPVEHAADGTARCGPVRVDGDRVEIGSHDGTEEVAVATCVLRAALDLAWASGDGADHPAVSAATDAVHRLLG